MSAATATKTLLTADEFYEFVNRPENDGRWFELVRGKVIELPAPTKIHGVASSNVGGILWNYVRQRGYGYITTNDSGVILTHDPDTVRGPDVALFEDATSFDDLHPKYGENPPVLAVEVITGDTKASSLAAKIDMYLNNGVKLVWIIDIENRAVRVHTSENRVLTYKDDQELDGCDILPGFRCRVADFFQLPGKAPEKPS